MWLIVDGKVPHMTVGALAGRSAATAAAVRERFGDLPYFTDPIEMMDSGTVDAIVTTLPHYLHPEMAIAGMDRGLHVLVEKPLGVYTKQVRRMLEVAEAIPSVVLGAMFNERANPLFARLEQVISSGELGQLRRGDLGDHELVPAPELRPQQPVARHVGRRGRRRPSKPGCTPGRPVAVVMRDTG